MTDDQEVAVAAKRETASKRRSSRWLLKLVLVGVAGIVGLIVCELATRWIVPQSPSWLAIYRRHPDLPFYGFQPNAERTVDTGETHWTVVTNSLSDRIGTQAAGEGESSAPGSGDRPWTLCLGDSFLFAHGVDYEQSFVGMLQRDHIAGSDFVNSGVPGYGPVQYRHVLEYRLDRADRQPDRLIVATFLGNDFQDCIWNKDLPVTDGILGKRSSWIDTIKQNSHLYRLSSRVYHQLVSHDSDSSRQRELGEAGDWDSDFMKRAEQTYREEFQRMAERCEARGIEMLVVILPGREEVLRIDREGFSDDSAMSEPRRRCRRILRELDIPTVDLTEALCQQPYGEVFFHFDGHLTPTGHKIVYEQIVSVLTDATPLADGS